MICLASKSPIRLQLLRCAGVAVTVVETRYDEASAQAESRILEPTQLALTLAHGKAAQAQAPAEVIVLGADQVLTLGDEIIHKAPTHSEARRTLARLRGRAHRLTSAVVAWQRGDIIWEHAAVADLTMRNFSDSFLDHYIARNAETVLETVGCYKIEHEGIQLFSEVKGDHSTILGLPLLPLLGFLREIGELPT